MSDNAQLTDALVQAIKRIDDLEAQVRRIEENPDYRNLSYIHQVLKRFLNITNIRGMFHTEILRSGGLINKEAVSKIEEKAKARYVTDPGYGLKPEYAEFNLMSVKSEMSDEYKTSDDFNPMFSKDKN